MLKSNRRSGAAQAPAENLPPQSTEAEQGVLGSMLLERDAVARVVEMIRDEDFYQEAHRRIYETMVDLFERGEPVDLITVTDRLKARGWLDEVGGASYVTSLLDAVPTAANVEYYAHLVLQKALLRQAAEAGAEIWTGITGGNLIEPQHVAAIMQDASQTLLERDQAHRHSVEALSLEDLLADTSPPPRPLVGGLIYPESITIAAGLTKIGKTQLVLQLARALVSGRSFIDLDVPQPASVLYMGQEDAWWALRKRMRGIDARFGPPQAALHMVAAKGLLLEGPQVRRLVQQHRPSLLILDPLRRFHIREEERGEMALVIREVDLLIRDFGLAVLLVHHLRKPGGEERRRRPEITDLRGHSVIGDQAHTIALLAQQEPGTFTMLIEGNYTETPQTLHLERVGPVFEREAPNATLTVSEAVAAFADRGPMTKAEAVRVLQARGVSRAQGYRRVADLVQAGWLVPADDGKVAINPALLEAGPGVRAGVVSHVSFEMPSQEAK